MYPPEENFPDLNNPAHMLETLTEKEFLKKYGVSKDVYVGWTLEKLNKEKD